MPGAAPKPVRVSSGDQTGSGTGAVAIAWPTGHIAGDICLLFVESANEVISLSTPAGFAEVTDSPQGTGTGAGTTATRIAVYWCRATSNAMATPTVADSGNHTACLTTLIRGAPPSGTPYHVTAGGTAASGTAVSIAGPTTTIPNCLVVVAVANQFDGTTQQDSAWANSALTGLVSASAAFVQSASGNGGGVSVNDGVLLVPGSTGTTTLTLANASVQAWVVITFAPGIGMSRKDQQTGSATPIAKAFTVEVGDTLLVGVGFDSVAGCVVTGITAGANVFRLLVRVVNGQDAVEWWSTEASEAVAAASVSVAFSGTAIDAQVELVTYKNVASIGATVSGSGAGANPSLSLTTQDADDFLVSWFLWLTIAGAATAGTGNLRQTDGNTAVTSALVDNTASTAASVTTSTTRLANTWAGVGVELRYTRKSLPHFSMQPRITKPRRRYV